MDHLRTCPECGFPILMRYSRCWPCHYRVIFGGRQYGAGRCSLCEAGETNHSRYCATCEDLVYRVPDIEKLMAVMELHTWIT